MLTIIKKICVQIISDTNESSFYFQSVRNYEKLSEFSNMTNLFNTHIVLYC